jgi:hypothetical protein
MRLDKSNIKNKKHCFFWKKKIDIVHKLLEKKNLGHMYSSKVVHTFWHQYWRRPSILKRIE